MDNISDDYDAVIVAVNHTDYKTLTMDYFKSIMNDCSILVDLKGLYEKPGLDSKLVYWRL